MLQGIFLHRGEETKCGKQEESQMKNFVALLSGICLLVSSHTVCIVAHLHYFNSFHLGNPQKKLNKS